MSAVVQPFNWKQPDYLAVYAQRMEKLRRLRTNPESLPTLRSFYAANPAQFISDWGCVAEPRNVERGLPPTTPFVLFPRQRELVEWIMERWHGQESGIIEKSRDSGLSWLTVALACTLCLFHRGMVIGFGSRKVEYVDALGAPRALMPKARFFLSHLPPEFLGGWTLDKHAPYMRISFPGTDAVIVGEGGDSIGRGDRTGLYVIDESAFLEHPAMIDASLSATTNCRIDVSTPNGMANSFAQRRFSGRVPVFTFHHKDDPRKGAAWYAKQQRELDPVTLAGEVDIDYRNSVEGSLIPSAWIQAAIGAHLKLGLHPTGYHYAGLDIADEGRDACAFAARHGFLLQYLQSWSGKGGDIYKSVVRAFNLCDGLGLESLHYDADGLGAGVRGDANRINEERMAAGKSRIRDEPFRGSGAVHDPEGEMVSKRKNKDFFANMKAISWWALRLRFQATHRAVSERMPYDPDSIISINPALPELLPLTMELSQPTYSISSVGKILIDKATEGMRSPNLADAVMIAFNPSSRTLEQWMRLGTNN